MQSTTQAMPLPAPPAATPANEHPFLVCRRSDFAALQARATRSPWRDMKAAALEHVASVRYHAGTTIDARSVVLARIFSTTALAYILDPSNRRRHAARVVDHLRHFAPGEPGNLTEAMRSNANKMRWTHATPTGNAFVQAVLALDVVHDDVPADDLIRVESILRDGPAQYFAETNLAWRQGSLAARAIWPLYERDAQAYGPIVDEWHRDVLASISDDGVFLGGTAYADARWTYGDREHKGLFGDVLARAGVLPDWYREPKLAAFQEWFNGYAFTPFRVCWPIGDSAPERHKARYQQGPERAYRYSERAGRYAAWLTERQVPPAGLAAYVFADSFDLAPAAAPSRVFADGGAWLKEASLDARSLSAVLYNARTFKDLHAHKETNAICLAAYGELLLRNAGYNGWNTPDHGFSWDYIHGRAIGGNTVLFDYAVPTTPAEDRAPSDVNDHVACAGAGITSSLFTGVVDVARGESGAAIPNGRHARELILVHPADGVAGYYVVVDEFDAPGAKAAHVVWHPNSDRHVVDAPLERYTWTADEFAGRDVGLTIFCATPPVAVAIREGVLANWTHGKIGTYLVADHALDASGRGRAVTVLFPHDRTHACATFDRGGSGVVIVRQGDVEDQLFTSNGSDSVAVGTNAAVTARAGLIRRDADGETVTIWLADARAFEIDGLAMDATNPVTICLRGDELHVSAAQPTLLTFRGATLRRPAGEGKRDGLAERVETVTVATGVARFRLNRN